MNPFKSNNMMERAKFMRTASPEQIEAAVRCAGLSNPAQLHKGEYVIRAAGVGLRKCDYCGRGNKAPGQCEGCGAP